MGGFGAVRPQHVLLPLGVWAAPRRYKRSGHELKGARQEVFAPALGASRAVGRSLQKLQQHAHHKPAVVRIVIAHG